MYYDLMIAGAGPVGASLAAALDHSGLRIAVIEPVLASDKLQPSYDGRSLVLNHVSSRILNGIGLWDGLSGERQAVRHIHVSRQGRFGVARIHAREMGVEALGYVVEAAALGQALQSSLAAHSGVKMFCPARVVGVESGADRITVSLRSAEGDTSIHGKLLVAADGARSQLRKLLGIGVSSTDYRQTAIVTTVSGASAAQGWAYERFTRGGPLALLPRSAGRYGVVWSVPSGEEQALLKLDERAFLHALCRAFGNRAGPLKNPGRRVSYPLMLSRAQRSLAPRCLLLGNASHAVHPVAGQGFNLGLRDVAWLAQVLVDAWNRQEDPGSEAVLRRYQDARQADQQATLRFTDILIRVFCNDTPLLASLGGLGLAITDLAAPLKYHLARGAMGYRGPASRLARGIAIAQPG